MGTDEQIVAIKNNIQFSSDGIKSAKDLAKRSSEEARQYIPVEFAFRLNSLPLGALLKANGIALTVAIPPEKQDTTILELKFLTGANIIPISLPQELIAEAIFDAYYGGITVFPGVLPDLNRSSGQTSLQNVTKMVDNSNDRKETPNSSNYLTKSLKFEQIVKLEQLDLLDKLIYYAVARHASDLHLTPAENGYFVRLRVDGELLSHRTPLSDSSIYNKMVRRLKVLGGLSLSPATQPEESSFKYVLPNKQISIRLSILPTLLGERVTLRILSTERIRLITELGYPQEISSWLEEALSHNDGLILLVGPTGSGKTTSLYALSYLLHHRGKSVVTLEDPVERVIPGIVQVPIDIKNGFSWEQAIAAALRHDPDVLIVGEVRSLAAAQAIVQASLSGHLVITSFHGGSVAQGLARMRALGVTWEWLLESLRLVIAQNLVPILCNYCKLPNGKKLSSKASPFVGCNYCSFTGYSGRSVIAEAMRCDEVVIEAFRNVDSVPKVIKSLSRTRYFPWHACEEELDNLEVK